MSPLIYTRYILRPFVGRFRGYRQTTAVRKTKQIDGRAGQCKICSSHLPAFYLRLFAVETEPLGGLKYQSHFGVSSYFLVSETHCRTHCLSIDSTNSVLDKIPTTALFKYRLIYWWYRSEGSPVWTVWSGMMRHSAALGTPSHHYYAGVDTRHSCFNVSPASIF